MKRGEVTKFLNRTSHSRSQLRSSHQVHWQMGQPSSSFPNTRQFSEQSEKPQDAIEGDVSDSTLTAAYRVPTRDKKIIESIVGNGEE